MTNNNKTERQEILNAVRARQRAKQRRFNILLFGSFGLVLAAIVTAVTIAITSSIQERKAAAEAARQPISGIQTFADQTRNHVQTAIDYPQQPGTGGDHSAVWTNCGAYTEAVNEQRAVHSLEHGAVWISHQPGLPADQLDALTALAQDNPYVLLSPVQDQPTPVTATAWGAQLPLKTPRTNGSQGSSMPTPSRPTLPSPAPPAPEAPMAETGKAKTSGQKRRTA